MWEEWDACVAEVADEEGKYLEREADWEPPYFDDTVLLEDLEQLAQQILPLLPTAYEHEFSLQIHFADAIATLPAEIAVALPDWIEPINARLYLEYHLTTCLLQWQWLEAQNRLSRICRDNSSL